jgi:ribose-phosphate pyrophosphokinase
MTHKSLNLVDEEKSDINFKISKFPDGQQTIDIETGKAFIKGHHVKISARIKTFRDLELIIAANQALREMEVGGVSLYVPYFLGARSDRKFRDGGVNYLKHVICPIINSQKFDCVIVLDPHSDVLEACLNNYEKIDNHLIVKYALTDIDNKDGAQDRIVLVSPDAGAYKKIFDVAQKFGIEQIITATKVRDIKTGKILHTEVPTLDQHKDLKYVIVDDICDGGRTFIELAKAIKGSRATAKVYLIVTHGIFSNGLYELSKDIEKIYCSNSYSQRDDIEYDSQYTVDKNFLTQFNVF